MVFSNTGHRTHSILKVVELTDTVKVERDLQVDPIGVALCSPAELSATTLEGPTEEFSKTEPLFESTMFHESDCEFFQDLDLWCSPDKEDPAKIIDVTENAKERANTTTTPITQLSSQTWCGPVADSAGHMAGDSAGHMAGDTAGQERFLDICKLPVVLGDLDRLDHTHPWTHTHYTDTHTNLNTPFIHQEDSLGYEPAGCISWSDCHLGERSEDVVISEYVVEPTALRLDVGLSAPAADVSTPDVLRDLELLETETFALNTLPEKKPQEVAELSLPTTFLESFEDLSSAAPSVAEYEPITPKTESHLDSDYVPSPASSRKRRKSYDSDDDYTPFAEQTTRKYKKRKQHVPLQDMIELLEGAAKTTTKRGRPPKKRGEPIPDPSLSVQEVRYRELRDKNNEASKRSRMNRKLKELQMEQQALKLEERNEKLRTRAKLLESMTKRLKDALMAAVLKT